MFDLTDFKEALKAVVEHFKSELSKVRTGRAHPDMLSGLKVEAYGTPTPINQVANVTVSDAVTLLITPFDPGNIVSISTAIRNDQSLGLNPADDGRVIRVPIPPLTEERRREIVKTTSEKVEQAKIAIRNIRQDTIKNLKNDKLPEDTEKRGEKEIDDETKKSTANIDELFKAKEAEILKV
ncbi:MAG: ribosome recycling factor [Candidatus Nomurabacteria bacterium]|jgi:ribosome recycling factor|nr:ribosome recycling factor [Candidatus Nomurabacteria bacterium]